MIDSSLRPRLGRRQVRDLQRLVHLLTAAVLIGYVYAAPVLGAGFGASVRWVALPLLVASGVALWKWSRIRSSLRSRRTRR